MFICIFVQGSDECGSNPCQNGGQCYDKILCRCAHGFYGMTCVEGEFVFRSFNLLIIDLKVLLLKLFVCFVFLLKMFHS